MLLAYARQLGWGAARQKQAWRARAYLETASQSHMRRLSLLRLEPEALRSRVSTSRSWQVQATTQIRLVCVGFSLALSAVPGVVTADALSRALMSSLTYSALDCDGLFSDDRGLAIVLAAALGPFLVMFSFIAVGFEASSKVARFVPHAALWGILAVALVFGSLAAGLTAGQAKQFDLRVVSYCVFSGVLVLFLPQLSYELWRALIWRRSSPLRFARNLAISMLISLFGAALATGCACYVLLSQRVQGIYSVLVNGAL